MNEMAGTIRVMVPQLMAERDMNISELAKELKISWPTARKLARGTYVPSNDQLVKLCELFNVKPGEILVYRSDNGDR